MKSIIFEGVDRLGKDTLIQGVKNRLGYFQTIHYQKPELLDFYLTEARKQTGRADDVALEVRVVRIGFVRRKYPIVIGTVLICIGIEIERIDGRTLILCAQVDVSGVDRLSVEI